MSCWRPPRPSESSCSCLKKSIANSRPAAQVAGQSQLAAATAAALHSIGNRQERAAAMSESAFETGLAERVAEMTDACTRCGKCVSACPSIEPAGLAAADPVETITGVIDILRTGTGSEEARRWASSCVLSGACIKACDYGVNPRFLLAMARIAIAKAAKDPATRRSESVAAFRKHQRTVATLSRLQITPEQLARLGQHAPGAARIADNGEP